MEHSEKVVINTKHGEQKKCLMQVSTDITPRFITKFLVALLPKLIDHRDGP